MKSIALIPMLFMASISYATNVRPLENDAFSTQEKADEAAAIINQNFIELFNTKVSTGGFQMGEISFFVSDMLSQEQADFNVFYITNNADELWADKAERDGGPAGTRSYDLVDLLDPAEIENNIARINLIFFEIDDHKEDQ